MPFILDFDQIVVFVYFLDMAGHQSTRVIIAGIGKKPYAQAIAVFTVIVITVFKDLQGFRRDIILDLRRV